MKLLVLVLNKVEILEELLAQLSEAGIGGATILHSTGMATALVQAEEDIPLFRTLAKILAPDREESRTLFMVLTEERISAARDVINSVTGGLDKPDTGILFSLPIDFVEGMVKG